MKTNITRIETFPVPYATAGYFKFFAGPQGRPANRPSVVVKITADDGSVGWGQSVPSHRWSYETPETVESTIKHYLASELIGLDPFDLEAVHAAMQGVIANSFSTGQPICKAGVELALFDLTGKMLGQSAAQRWQRQGRVKIPLSWTVNVRSLEEAEVVVAQGLARGYRKLLEKTLDHRWWVVMGCIAFFFASMLLNKTLRHEFVPAQDQSMFLCSLETPVGSSLEFTNARFKQAEDKAGTDHLTGLPNAHSLYLHLEHELGVDEVQDAVLTKQADTPLDENDIKVK